MADKTSLILHLNKYYRGLFLCINVRQFFRHLRARSSLEISPKLNITYSKYESLKFTVNFCTNERNRKFLAS